MRDLISTQAAPPANSALQRTTNGTSWYCKITPKNSERNNLNYEAHREGENSPHTVHEDTQWDKAWFCDNIFQVFLMLSVHSHLKFLGV